MKHGHPNFSLAVAAGGLLGFVVLISGVWHPKFPAGGLTQVGRHARLTFADGSVMDLSEPDTDLDILRRRRMGGWAGQEYRQVFITADGEEINVLNNRLGANDTDELDSGNQLILAAYTPDAKADTTLNGRDGVQVASLQTDGKTSQISGEIDGKDSVVTDVIDGKDRVFTERDAKDAPVFALTPTEESLEAERLDMILMGDPDTDWGSLRTVSGTGLIGFGTGGNSTGGTTISTPPIGIAVPEPSTLPLVGLAGVLVLAGIAWKRAKSVTL